MCAVVCLSFSFLAMALSVCFRFMSLTVPLVSFVPLLYQNSIMNTWDIHFSRSYYCCTFTSCYQIWQLKHLECYPFVSWIVGVLSIRGLNCWSVIHSWIELFECYTFVDWIVGVLSIRGLNCWSVIHSFDLLSFGFCHFIRDFPFGIFLGFQYFFYFYFLVEIREFWTVASALLQRQF